LERRRAVKPAAAVVGLKGRAGFGVFSIASAGATVATAGT
jgi:hypothetical protein